MNTSISSAIRPNFVEKCIDVCNEHNHELAVGCFSQSASGISDDTQNE